MPTSFAPVSNSEKQAVWDSYGRRQPTRVPVRLSHNPRIILLDPTLNTEGYTFEQAANDPRIHVAMSLQHAVYQRMTLNKFTDSPTGLPEVWEIGMWVHNVYEAACLGAEVYYPPQQIPSTEPFLTDANRESIFECDIEHPLDSPFCKYWLHFWHEMERICQDLRFEGRPVKLVPWALGGTDGPVTVGCNVRGTDFLMELAEDDGYAIRLMEFITRAAILRRRAFEEYWGDRLGRANWLADDSCAMLSLEMYRQKVMPSHRRFYDAADPGMNRNIHLCGNSTHLFDAIHRELGVTSFDTGFPVDHGAIRRRLGPNVEISGGPEVSLLLQGTPDQVHRRTSEILQSGIKDGGRFILQEGNNLPPRCPLANLEAMYAACLEHGRYDSAK